MYNNRKDVNGMDLFLFGYHKCIHRKALKDRLKRVSFNYETKSLISITDKMELYTQNKYIYINNHKERPNEIHYCPNPNPTLTLTLHNPNPLKLLKHF